MQPATLFQVDEIDGLLMRVKTADWRKVIDTNLSSVFFLCRAASRLLLKAKESGRIVNVTSVVGEMGNTGQVSYVSAKAGGVYSSWGLSDEYGFTDIDGRRPHWGRYFAEHVAGR